MGEGELRQRHEVDIGFIIEPLSPCHEFFAEIPEMRDRATEARQPELEESGEDFGRATAARSRMRVRRFGHSAYC